MGHRPFEQEYLLYSSTQADLAAHAPSRPRVDGHPVVTTWTVMFAGFWTVSDGSDILRLVDISLSRLH
jgi:hypothetical protein